MLGKKACYIKNVKQTIIISIFLGQLNYTFMNMLKLLGLNFHRCDQALKLPGGSDRNELDALWTTV